MQKGVYVKAIRKDEPVEGFFLVRRPDSRKTKAGAIFWTCTLVDASGEIEGKIWKPESCGLAELPPEGSLIHILDGIGNAYKNTVQLSIQKATLLDDITSQRLDPHWFRATSEQSTETMWAELNEACDREFLWEPWSDFVHSVFNDFELVAAFCACPGAIEIHHAYEGGLLEHTLSVFRLCQHFASLYPELDRQTLLCGALFHDIGKIREYAYALDISSTDEGRLLGHLTMGVSILEPFLQQSDLPEALSLHLKHLILSHHGTAAFGACVEPHTPEAVVLHMADNLDAKLAIFRKHRALCLEKGTNWSDPVYALEHKRLYFGEKTPANPSGVQIPQGVSGDGSGAMAVQLPEGGALAKNTSFEQHGVAPEQSAAPKAYAEGFPAANDGHNLQSMPYDGGANIEENGRGKAAAKSASLHLPPVRKVAEPSESFVAEEKRLAESASQEFPPVEERVPGEIEEQSITGSDTHDFGSASHGAVLSGVSPMPPDAMLDEEPAGQLDDFSFCDAESLADLTFLEDLPEEDVPESMHNELFPDEYPVGGTNERGSLVTASKPQDQAFLSKEEHGFLVKDTGEALPTNKTVQDAISGKGASAEKVRIMSRLQENADTSSVGGKERESSVVSSQADEHQAITGYADSLSATSSRVDLFPATGSEEDQSLVDLADAGSESFEKSQTLPKSDQNLENDRLDAALEKVDNISPKPQGSSLAADRPENKDASKAEDVGDITVGTHAPTMKEESSLSQGISEQGPKKRGRKKIASKGTPAAAPPIPWQFGFVEHFTPPTEEKGSKEGE